MTKRICFLLIAALLASAVASAQPVIRADNGVLNASSYRPDIARGSWLVIFGSNMGPGSKPVQAVARTYPQVSAAILPNGSDRVVA